MTTTTPNNWEVEYREKIGLYNISHEDGPQHGRLSVSMRELENILEAAKQEG